MSVFHAEYRALSELAAHAVVVIMQLQHCLHYRQSESRTDYLALVVFRTVILVENKLYLVLFNAFAGIFDLNENSFRSIYLPYKYLFILAGLVYGIIDEVIDDLLYLADITADVLFAVRRE